MNAPLSMSEAQAMDGPTAGALLRKSREAAGLHVAALAVSLKVPVRKIEALEQDRLDELPDAVFARALASSVCRTLKIDPQPILDRLPQGSAPRLVHDRDGINAPFRAPGDAVPAHWRNQFTRPLGIVVGALLLGALVLVFMPTIQRDDPLAGKPEGAPGVPMAAVVTLPPTVADAPAASASEPAVATPVSMATPATDSPAAGSAPATAATVAAPAPAPAPAVQAATESPVASTGTVVFKTRGPSWVEVTDAKGIVALRRLMAAGETIGASGNPPLTITVGSSRDTTVQVRGKPFDLAPVSKDNVARFEVK